MTNSEPVEAEAEEENAVATRGTHLASTQTVTHEYLTQSGKVMRETVKTNGTVTTVLDFIYDESGKPFAMIDQLSAQPNTYYYVLNLQGDVVKLIGQDGAVAASYEYDAWGNILASSGSMAEKNPLRYRGYYYDSETGFYYLQSRYYDPTNHRFINADVYTSTGQGFVGTNMFAYCNNNVTIGFDPLGHYNLSVRLMATDCGRDDNEKDADKERDTAKRNAKELFDSTKFTLNSDTMDVVASLDITQSEIKDKLNYGDTAYYYSNLVAEETQRIAVENPAYRGMSARHVYLELEAHVLGKELFEIENCNVIDMNESESRLSVGLSTLFVYIFNPYYQ